MVGLETLLLTVAAAPQMAPVSNSAFLDEVRPDLLLIILLVHCRTKGSIWAVWRYRQFAPAKFYQLKPICAQVASWGEFIRRRHLN
jgi:hypothetical protein